MKGTRIVQINAINEAWGHVAKGPSFSLLHLLMKPGSCSPPSLSLWYHCLVGSICTPCLLLACCRRKLYLFTADSSSLVLQKRTCAQHSMPFETLQKQMKQPKKACGLSGLICLPCETVMCHQSYSLAFACQVCQSVIARNVEVVVRGTPAGLLFG